MQQYITIKLIFFFSFCALFADGQNNSLFVFVGEKISVDKLPNEKESMDDKFVAKYKIIQKVYGQFNHDTIDFVAYDHYGYPQFAKYENAMLYVFQDSGVWYHAKYLYSPIFKTSDNKWAGPYGVDDYRHENNKKTNVKPEIISFNDSAYIDLKGIIKPNIQNWFPSPYYKIVGDKAIPIYGNYIDDLFKLKKNGFLKERKLL